jgi:SAM-dependent methyltransferase
VTTTRFPSAPSWYRPVLTAEDAILYRLRNHLPTQNHLHDETHLDTCNFVLNERLGVLAAERMVPGNNASPHMIQHIARYLWAMARVRGCRVIDLGCGDGYGSELLSWVCPEVIGIDIDEGALTAARARYQHPQFYVGDLTDPTSIPQGQVAVCFEVIEHLPDPKKLLAAVSERVPRLLMSVPNPLVSGSHINPHHVNDWPKSFVKTNLRNVGAKRIRAYNQGLRRYDVRRFAAGHHGTWLFDVQF